MPGDGQGDRKTLAISGSAPEEVGRRKRDKSVVVSYNFGRVHQTFRVTPAMEAGVANHAWSIEEIVSLLDAL
jgi:hypothetical protein